jgi:hypothetical protein
VLAVGGQVQRHAAVLVLRGVAARPLGASKLPMILAPLASICLIGAGQSSAWARVAAR